MEGMEADLQELYDALVTIGKIFGPGLTTYTDEEPGEQGRRLHDGMHRLAFHGCAKRVGGSGTAVFWNIITPPPSLQSSPADAAPAAPPDHS